MELVQMPVLRYASTFSRSSACCFTSSTLSHVGRVRCCSPYPSLPSPKRGRGRPRKIEPNTESPDISFSHQHQNKKEKEGKQQQDYKVKVEKRDAHWVDDSGVKDRWKVRASDYFNEVLIRNTVGEDGTLIDWEGECAPSKCRVQEITALEWENIAFHPSPLVVLVFQRYVRASDNWKVLKELEKAIQIFWDSKKLPPRTMKIDAKIEKDLASALGVNDTPQLLFIRRAKLLHRDTEVRTADDLVKMIAHFYYNAKRPLCLSDMGSF